jgi:hypothetical protein
MPKRAPRRPSAGASGNGSYLPKTLVFYRDCRATGVGGARLCVAVTIEPFEVSRWGGGCGGLLWDFNQAGSVVGLGCGGFGAGAVAFGWA